MPSLLLLVFCLQLAIHLINTIGTETITSLAWFLYGKLTTPTSKKAREAVRLRNEVVRLKQELNATSAQDEFSKWAKLRRQHDKAMEQQEKLSKELGSFKSQFDTGVKALRWMGTTGLRVVFQMYFQRQPVFWVPKGWAPYFVEWLLSFPRAPVGGVSVQIWTSACGAVITLVTLAITAVWALATQQAETGKTGRKEEPMKMKSEIESSPQAKKEL